MSALINPTSQLGRFLQHHGLASYEALCERASADAEWFWRAVLGYAELAHDNGFDPLGHGSTFWVQALDPGKPLRHAMHIDVSLAREHADQRVAAAIEAGGQLVQDSNAPGSWILADRAGSALVSVY